MFCTKWTQYNTITTNRLCKIAHLVLSYNYMIGLVNMQKLWSNQKLQDICPCSTRQLPTGGPFSTLELLAKINHIARAMKPAPWMICAMLWGSSKSICDARNVSIFDTSTTWSWYYIQSFHKNIWAGWFDWWWWWWANLCKTKSTCWIRQHPSSQIFFKHGIKLKRHIVYACICS